MDTCSCCEIGPKFPTSRIECWTCHLRRPITRRYLEGTSMPEDKIEQIAMCNLYTFGTTGRARSINDIKKIVNCSCASWLSHTLLCQQFRISIQADDLRILSSHMCRQRLLCHEHRSLDVC